MNSGVAYETGLRAPPFSTAVLGHAIEFRVRRVYTLGRPDVKPVELLFIISV